MATRTYYKHTRTENTNIPYNFQCENCMKNSGDLQALVVGEATCNSNFKTLSEDKSNKLKAEAHKYLVKRVKEVYKDATEKEIYCTEFKDECPHCHKSQSWAISGLKKERFDMPIGILIVGVIIFIVALIGHYCSTSQDVPLSIAFGVLGVAVACAIIAFIWNTIKINKKIKETSANGTNNIPNIDWNKVQDLLDEEN